MIRTITALATVVALAGCGGGSDPKESTPTKQATATPTAAGIPSPSREESIELVDKLDTIVPGAGQEAERTITHARDVCTSILGKAPNLEASTAARFASGDQAVSEDQARAILTVVRGQKWCTA